MQSVTDRSGARSVVKSRCHVIRLSVCLSVVCVFIKRQPTKVCYKSARERKKERERDERTEIFSLYILIIYISLLITCRLFWFNKG